MKKKYRRLGKKQAESIVRRLKEVNQTATMESANFDGIGNTQRVTPMIREKTSLWRGSWIIAPIDGIIAELNEIYALDNAK